MNHGLAVGQKYWVPKKNEKNKNRSKPVVPRAFIFDPLPFQSHQLSIFAFPLFGMFFKPRGANRANQRGSLAVGVA